MDAGRLIGSIPLADGAVDTLKRAHWQRSLKQVTSRSGAGVEIGAHNVLNFASNDYLGLASDPRLVQAATQAMQDYGVGATGSRLLSGHRALHRQLEIGLARWKRTEEALVFSSGYAACLGTVVALVGSWMGFSKTGTTTVACNREPNSVRPKCIVMIITMSSIYKNSYRNIVLSTGAV